MTTQRRSLDSELANLGSRSTLRLLWRSYRFLLKYRQTVISVYAFVIVINILNAVIPQFIRWIIDEGIGKNNLTLLGWSVLGLLGLTLIKGIFVFIQGRQTEVASQGVAYDVRNAIQAKLTQLSFSYHDKTEAGQLLSRTLQDAERIRFLTGRATFRLVDSLILLIATSVILVWMNPLLALLSLGTMPILVHRAIRFGAEYRPLSVFLQDQLAVLTARLEQNLRGAQVVKAFAQEDAEIKRFDDENEHWFELAEQSARIQGINVPLLQLIGNIGTVAIIWYGGTLVIRQELTIGELVAFTTYLSQLTNPIRFLGLIIPAIAMAGTASERIFEIIDTEPDVKDIPNAPVLPKVEGHVQFDRVAFRYGDGPQTLTDISFAAHPGQVIALTGPTGSGKSTIINLIPRFYDPTQGKILIDGHDIQTVQLKSLREQIGLVLQETVLFAASIRENIAFGRPNATEAEIIAAVKSAQAHDFIMEMPDGYDSPVGERGVTLSGGQKQRLAIARALITDPRILILDDASASVDTHTELLLQKALNVLMQGRTTFVIAHRLSTVQRADMILVLEGGRITAKGSHEHLLESSPLYAEIYEHQLRPQEILAQQGEPT
ncbi:MAG: ABC transporter ATP-binding protein [Chloroflexota bacterium]